LDWRSNGPICNKAGTTQCVGHVHGKAWIGGVMGQYATRLVPHSTQCVGHVHGKAFILTSFMLSKVLNILLLIFFEMTLGNQSKLDVISKCHYTYMHHFVVLGVCLSAQHLRLQHSAHFKSNLMAFSPLLQHAKQCIGSILAPSQLRGPELHMGEVLNNNIRCSNIQSFIYLVVLK